MNNPPDLCRLTLEELATIRDRLARIEEHLRAILERLERVECR